MKYDTARRHALSLPEVTEAPHHNFGSFRVRGKIFVTVPPGEKVLHVFVDEMTREQALVLHPDVVEKLFWGAKVLGLRVLLDAAPAALVKRLISAAWTNKAPKTLVAGA